MNRHGVLHCQDVLLCTVHGMDFNIHTLMYTNEYVVHKCQCGVQNGIKLFKDKADRHSAFNSINSHTPTPRSKST